MADCRLDRDVLEIFSRGALSAAEALRVEFHLRSGCVACQRRIDEVVRSLLRVAGGADVADIADIIDRAAVAADTAAAEDAAWERVLAGLERRLALVSRERGAAPALVAELLGHPPAEREAVARAARFRNLAVCELLIERSFEEGFQDPARAIELAGLALGLVDRLDAGWYGRSVVQDLRARAWAHLGNARRIASDLAGAEQALIHAESLLAEGSADPLEEARVLDLKASLLSDQGWFERAAEVLEEVIEIYEEIRDPHRRGRALISQGLFIGYAGQPEEAVGRISEGLALIDAAEEPRLALMARHNLAWFLNDCGRVGEALALLERTRCSYHSFGDPWTELRLLWLEGRIALGLGRDGEAEAGLRAVRESFLQQGLGYDAAMVTLDLAGLYLRQGRSAEVRRLAEEMLCTFLAQDVHRQAAAALAALQQAVEMDRATPRLVREIAAYLLRARKNPRLRFAGL
jgi:tetratricopeptide (TPR) repeat protein